MSAGFVGVGVHHDNSCLSNRDLFGEVRLAEIKFTSSPSGQELYGVGDLVEVLCDHDRNNERIRDWLVGTVVQVDLKMIAVQFQENVYLTDGWMVPDHVLWCPKTSINVRIARRRKKMRQKAR